MKHLRTLSKKWLLFTAGAFLLLLLSGYACWSVFAWGGYEKSYTQRQQEVSNALDSVWSMPADTIEQKQMKLTRLADLSAETTKVSQDLCRQSIFIGWQRVIQANANLEADCKRSAQSMEEFTASLRPVIVFLQQAEAFSKIIATAPSQAEVAEGEFEEQLNAWRSVLNSLQHAGAEGKLTSVKQSAESSTEAVIKAWEAIIAAHAAKDKARYSKATQELAAAYDELGEISKVHTEQLTVLVGEIKK